MFLGGDLIGDETVDSLSVHQIPSRLPKKDAQVYRVNRTEYNGLSFV